MPKVSHQDMGEPGFETPQISTLNLSCCLVDGTSEGTEGQLGRLAPLWENEEQPIFISISSEMRALNGSGLASGSLASYRAVSACFLLSNINSGTNIYPITIELRAIKPF